MALLHKIGIRCTEQTKNPPTSGFWRWVLIPVGSFYLAQETSPEDGVIRLYVPLVVHIVIREIRIIGVKVY